MEATVLQDKLSVTPLTLRLQIVLFLFNISFLYPGVKFVLLLQSISHLEDLMTGDWNARIWNK